ncbi:GDP-mannose mannosyl hydrolase [Vibrio crassostreae]|uniref:GDP-mannose mannosyl hydrolase n=1 Tax=Vibrio crassostreae TaxID=246167 RepID=UPI001048457D|nr:GDP-mannose mannosyl hydrolase [Vibrio crassostreae]TCN84403.1 colanic acid biosynthesis protein WcaH [Vibrio crassostreae]CAK2408970.1 GDP-mannose mannosyl hydrolase [Vibrio crassostreae]CAK2414827.1 GDP-mannose mannosyl hydrolase [Vibrio crassostreae]CAK3608592.1 GDP-mannose mannosyl hydrolase [Vibrio crassostreae]CAK3795296.1 GDP-mannose mannosyl hydrolase [Vibrio crassostreae]
MLPINTFKTIIEHTPLISIDLIVRNSDGEVLLGKRLNRPAQRYWFVPGGRILKDEPFTSAFNRLIKDELGLDYAELKFRGIYQHFYDDNFSEDDFTTHYVVLAYEINIGDELSSLPLEQHSSYQWFSEYELLNNQQTHIHTKWYFQDNKQVDFDMATMNTTLK